MRSNTSNRSRVAQSLLMLVNLGFLAAGIVMIVYAVRVGRSAWLRVYSEDFPWIRPVVYGCMIALGCVTMAISLAGCAGATLERRGLLCCYNFFVIAALVLVLVVMIGAFVSMSAADDWSAAAYPAARKETALADGFNRAYCYAEAAYLCAVAPLDDIMDTLIPGVPTGVIEGMDGINSLCEHPIIGGVGAAVSDDLEAVCAECEKVGQYEAFHPVLSWVDSQCPLVEAGFEVLGWCRDFLFEGRRGGEYDGAPYGACRPQFLGLWSDTSRTLGVSLAIFLAILVVVMVSAGVMMRRRNSATREPGEGGARRNSRRDSRGAANRTTGFYDEDELHQGATVPAAIN